MIKVPSAYFGSTAYFALLMQADEFEIEKWERFPKQSYRSRCEIYGHQGKLKLIVPLKKWNNKSLIQDIQISYDEDWRKLHWKSLESAYRASPYFEFYEEEIYRFLFEKIDSSLLEFNIQSTKLILNLLQLDITLTCSKEYEEQRPDWRVLLSPKSKYYQDCFKFPEYYQVFSDRKGFIPNLSILDLLFNLGPASIDYLNSIELNLQNGKKNQH